MLVVISQAITNEVRKKIFLWARHFITVHFKLLFTSLKEIHGENKKDYIILKLEAKDTAGKKPFLDSCMIHMPMRRYNPFQ